MSQNLGILGTLKPVDGCHMGISKVLTHPHFLLLQSAMSTPRVVPGTWVPPILHHSRSRKMLKTVVAMLLYWMCSMAMQKEPIYSRYLPYICLNFREYPNKNMARNMVLTYLHFRILLKLLLIFSRACLKLWYRLTHRLAISMIRNNDYSSSSRPIAIFSDKPV